MRYAFRMSLEEELERLQGEERWEALTKLIVSSYGPEVLGFLTTLARNEADANDAFAQACEDLWKGLPKFQLRASHKTWFYTLARHALSRLWRSPAVRRCQQLSAVSELAERIRSETAPYLRSEVKDGVAAIRAELSAEDRALLVLRVDRGMAWDEVARVMLESHETDTDTDILRVTARLRKRFQSVKETIRKRALQMGLAGLGDGE
jgi:RNA polymerase sigma-70 factor (ECF subfamily)